MVLLCGYGGYKTCKLTNRGRGSEVRIQTLTKKEISEWQDETLAVEHSSSITSLLWTHLPSISVVHHAFYFFVDVISPCIRPHLPTSTSVRVQQLFSHLICIKKPLGKWDPFDQRELCLMYSFVGWCREWQSYCFTNVMILPFHTAYGWNLTSLAEAYHLAQPDPFLRAAVFSWVLLLRPPFSFSVILNAW